MTYFFKHGNHSKKEWDLYLLEKYAKRNSQNFNLISAKEEPSYESKGEVRLER